MMKRIFFLPLQMALALVSTAPLHAADELISPGGDFGSFIRLGAGVAEVRALGPDRVEPAATETQRVASSWYYFNSRGIRVRVCEDDQRVATVNAGIAPVTKKYLTEAGVRLGDDLDRTREVYGERLQPLPESGELVWFVDQDGSNIQLTFGFSAEGRMNWVALGALRQNGWTCGVQDGG